MRVSVLLAVLLAACTTVAPPPPVAAPAPDAYVKIWEGGCFYPTCATYTLTLHPDGSYQMQGDANVRTLGASTGTLPANAWTKAEAAFTAAGFATMPEKISREGRAADAGPPCMFHMPGVRITRHVSATEEKSLYWDQGCPSPQARALVDGLHDAFGYDALVKPAPR